MIIDVTIYKGAKIETEIKATGSGAIHKAGLFVERNLDVTLQELSEAMTETGSLHVSVRGFDIYFVEALRESPKPKAFK